MSRIVTIEVQLPDELPSCQLPTGVQYRLQELLDRQDRGRGLTAAERAEAEGLVSIADTLSLLGLRVQPDRSRIIAKWPLRMK